MMGKSSSIILLAWARSVWILAVRNPVMTELLKLLILLWNCQPKWRIFGLAREAGHSKPNQCNKYPKLPTQWNATETREFREFFFMQTSENRSGKVPYTEPQPTVPQYFSGESLVLRLLHLCCSKSGQGRQGARIGSFDTCFEMCKWVVWRVWPGQKKWYSYTGWVEPSNWNIFASELPVLVGCLLCCCRNTLTSV